MLFSLAIAITLVAPLAAQEPTEIQPATETSRFVFDSILLLAGAFSALLLAAGLALREVGLARGPAPSVFAKCLAAIAIAAIAMWLVGANLIDGVEPGGFLGNLVWWSPADADPLADGRASGAAFLFKLALAAGGVMIVSGAIAERAKLWPFLVFAAVFAAVIFPVAASWAWGGGVLEAQGFADFGGATVIHSAAGWAALTGAFMAGPRYVRQDSPRVAAPQYADPNLAAAGAVVFLIGGLGVIAAFGSISTVDATATAARAMANAVLAASAGVLVAMIMTQIVYSRLDVASVNGAIGALVAISAEPAAPALWQAAIIGGFAGAIVTLGPPLLARFKIDDVAGSVPAHLFCGIWGTLIVPWTKEGASYLDQVVGIAMIAAFATAMSFLVWTLLKYTVGLRLDPPVRPEAVPARAARKA